MSEEEFLAWVDEFTDAEWVDGEVIIKSPVSARHADINRWLTTLLSIYIEEHDLGQIRGDVLVRMVKPPALRVPDIYFYTAQRASLQGATIFEGPPDIIFEIVSPGSTTRDYRDKVKNYQASGVREYWIIDPLSRRAEANELVKRSFKTIEEKDGALHSKILRNFWLRPDWFWQMPLPKVKEVLRELGIK